MLKDKLLLVIVSTVFSANLFASSLDKRDSLFGLSIQELLDIQITGATKTPLSLKLVPATVVAITSQQIQQRGYESLEDVIRDLPGIDIVDVQGTFPVIWAPRGAYGDENKRTLLLIDGIVENNILEGNVLGGPQYSLHNVERIEFLWGPASALYGANAFSGVINIITRKGRDIDGTEVHLIAGQNNTQSVKLLAGKQVGEFEYSVSASIYDTDGFRFTERHPNYSLSYVDNAYSLVGRVNYKNHRFGVHRYDRPMGHGQFANPANAIFGLPLFGFENSEGQAFDNSISPVDINGQRGSLWHSITTSAFAEFNQSFESLEFKELIYYRESEIADDSYAYTLLQGEWAFIPFTHFSKLSGLQLQLDYAINESDNLILGFDFEGRNVERGYRENFVVQNSPLVYGIGDERVATNYYNRSVFGQYRLSSDAFYNTTYTLGARFDDNSVYGSTFNPRLGIVVLPSDQLTVKALLATAFRAPNSFDLFTETPIRIANPDLNPETSHNYELSAGYQFSESTFVEAIMFYNHLEDMIVSNVTLGDIDNDGTVETQNQNVGTANIYGIELRSQYTLARRLKAFLNVSFQSSELKQSIASLQPGQVNGQEIPNTARWKSNFGLSWQTSDTSSLYFSGRVVGTRSTTHTNPRPKIPGYFVADLVVNYQLPFFEDTSVSLRINNLLDRDYADPGIRSANGMNFSTQHDYPGRNAWVKLTATF